MINIINHPIEFDLAKPIDTINAIRIKKNDTASHKFVISVLNNSVAYDLTGLTARIYFAKHDGTKVFLDCMLDDAENGLLGVVLTTQALSCAGLVSAEVTIYGTAGELLTSTTFTFSVNSTVRDDAAIQSSNEFTALTTALTTYNALKSEVESARGGQASLGARLDGMDSSLAGIANRPIGNSSNLNGKIWVACGDSITEVNFRTTKNYHKYIQEWTGCTVANYGLSGSGYYSKSGISGTISQTPDLITVFYGTNDWANIGSNNKALGVFGDTGTTTIAGCINTLLSGLITRFPTKLIAVITPLPRSENWGSNAAANTQGYTLEQLANMVVAICKHYSIPCLDLYHESNLRPWNSTNNAMFFSCASAPNGDGLHPNALGHELMAYKIINFLNGIMGENGAVIDTSAPIITASPSAGSYNSTQSVTLTSNETATIYYTTDGSTPTTSSAVYSSPISIASNTTLKYFAKDTAGNSSDVQTSTYTFDTTVPTVTLSPVAGTYDTVQSATLSANETATIYYTLDGSTPTISSPVYNSPISIGSSLTLKYFAKDAAGNSSTVQSAAYTINVTDTTPPTVTVSPSAGTYGATQSVTLSANETATIYYTTDGTTPTESSSVYSSAISISSTTTLKYFAKDTAGNSSVVQSATYTINVGVVNDSFNRANNATSLGNADTGQTWVVGVGTFGISSNQAYCYASGENCAVINSGNSDVTMQVKIANYVNNSRIVFRYVDSNNYCVVNLESKFNIYKKVSGTFTSVATSSALTFANGDIIKVVTSGSTITCYQNDTLMLTTTLTANQTGTSHGIGGYNNSSARFDDFSII